MEESTVLYVCARINDKVEFVFIYVYLDPDDRRVSFFLKQ